MNALWHGLASVLVALLLARALSPAAALAGGLVFALHPVHTEAVAGLVGRAEVLAAAGMFGAVLCARRRRWVAAVACAAAAMLSKEHGVITGVLIVLDRWLQHRDEPPYPRQFYVALGIVTATFLGAWYVIGGRATGDVASVFSGAGTTERLELALPAVARATGLLVWPVNLSADYGPRVIPAYRAFSLAEAAGAPRARPARRGPGPRPARLAGESLRRLRSAGDSCLPRVLARGARRQRDGRRDARGRVVGEANGAGVDVRGVGRRGRVSPHVEFVVSLRGRARGTRSVCPGVAGRGRGGLRGGLGAEPLEAAARRPGGWGGALCVRGHDAGAAAGVA